MFQTAMLPAHNAFKRSLENNVDNTDLNLSASDSGHQVLYAHVVFHCSDQQILLDWNYTLLPNKLFTTLHGLDGDV